MEYQKKNYQREIERAQREIARQKQRIEDITFKISQKREEITYLESRIDEIDEALAADQDGEGTSESKQEAKK